MTRVFTKREKIILYLTIVIIIFSVGFRFLFSSVLDKNDTLNNEIKITRLKLEKYLRLLSQKEYIQANVNKFSSTFKASDQQQETLVNALSELESLAKNAGIRIIDLRPQSPKTAALYKEMVIDFRTEGAMEGYFKFIYDIEKSLSLLRIKRLQLNTKPNIQALEGNFSISQVSISE